MESDAEFLFRFAMDFDFGESEDLARLFALARRGAALPAVLDAASNAISHVARLNSSDRIIEARAMVLRAALPPPPAGATSDE